MQLGTQEHHDIMSAFECEYRGYRMDREDESLWESGYIYQSGDTNNLFLAYRRGYAFGRIAAS